MKMKVSFDKSAKDFNWGFTEASLPRFHKGSELGILICHGFGCTPTTMRCLYDRAVSMGATAVMPLLSGHAKTFGELEKVSFSDWIRDAADAYERLVDSGCERIILCGLSLGALLMADLASKRRDDGRIMGVILICPPIRMKAYLNFFSFLSPLIPYVRTADGFRDPEFEMYYGMATRKLNDIRRMAVLAKRAAESIDAPTLLIEAGRDSRVNPVSYRILKSKLSDVEHVIIKDAPHGIPYSSKRDKLSDMFEGFIKGLEY